MQLIYFPHLMLGNIDELSYGNINIWNFQKKSAEYIPDETLRNKLKALLAINKYGGQPIQDMGIFSIGDIDFRDATPQDINTANEIKLILFLTYLAQNNVTAQGANAGLRIATSENFLYVVQNFHLESDYISESSGYIVNRTVGGYKVGEISFIAPPYVLKPLGLVFDSDLTTTLLRLKTEDSILYSRILRATDLLFQSYFNNSEVSLNARILLQVGALEVLLDLPPEKQRSRLKEAVEKLTSLPTDPVETYQYEIRPGTFQTETRSIKVKWADRFYSLRNHIIHGNEVASSEFVFASQRHFDIATMFFVLLTEKRLNDRFREKVFYDQIEWNKYKDEDWVDHDGFIFYDGSLAKYFATSRDNNT
ncbi:MAG TPA: hypothetical protein VEL49_09245 [Ktedonobacteraceae bacterium]|nr:hypothetical protein [Ktedonobacteraceae bacterium]